MERIALQNRWCSEKWEACGVLPGLPVSEPRVLVQDERRLQMLFPGFELTLFPSEAGDYYLNLSAPQPKVFVMWRLQGDLATPVVVTVGYGEAVRLLDSGEQVDAVAMPPDVADWLGDFVNRHYRPEPKQARRRGRRPA